jgi:hypothetical protein
MGFITLTGDSDGDLHTAALHNNKFGAIASVLNGNVDHNNLKYPFSVGAFNFVSTGPNTYEESGGGAASSFKNMEWYDMGTSATSATIVANEATAAATRSNVLKASWVKIPKTIQIESVRVIANRAALVSGENYTFNVQSASSLTGTYSTNATGTFDFVGAISTPVETTLTVNTPGISANSYMRFLLTNPSTFTAPGLPPSFSVYIEYKVYTVA